MMSTGSYNKMASFALFIFVFECVVRRSTVDAGLHVLPKDTIAILGNNATLECSACCPDPSRKCFVDWSIKPADGSDYQLIFQTEQIRLGFEGKYRLDMTSKPNLFILVIDVVQTSHAGRYKCCHADGCNNGEAVAELVVVNRTSFTRSNPKNTGAFPFRVTAFGERTAIEKVFKDQFSSPSMNELMQTSVDCKRSSNANPAFNCTIDVACPTCSTAVSSLLYGSRVSWFILVQCCIASFLLQFYI